MKVMENNESDIMEEDLGNKLKVQVTDEGGVFLPPEYVEKIEMLDLEDRKVPRITLSEPIMIVGYKCVKCGHEWIPKTPDPVVCAECKNPNWRG